MRQSLAFVSVEEMAHFNRTAHDMLGFINECVKVEGDWFLYFSFEKTRDHERVSFCGKAKLFRDYGQDNPILIGESEHSRVFYFYPPEGCNVEQSFEVLFWEVAKLAFAMTQGNVRYAAQSFSQHSDGSWTLPFLKRSDWDDSR